MNNAIAEKSGSVYTGAQTNEQGGLDEGNHWGLVEPAPSTNGNDVAPAHMQHSTQDNDPHHVTNRAGAVEGFYNIVKRPHQILACELIVLTLCCAWSLQICQFPIGDGRQKRTYNNLENAHDKSSAFPCCCYSLHCTPSECRRVLPR